MTYDLVSQSRKLNKRGGVPKKNFIKHSQLKKLQSPGTKIPKCLGINTKKKQRKMILKLIK